MIDSNAAAQIMEQMRARLLSRELLQQLQTIGR